MQLTVLVEKLGMTGSELGQLPRDTVAIESAHVNPNVMQTTKHKIENFISNLKRENGQVLRDG